MAFVPHVPSLTSALGDPRNSGLAGVSVSTTTLRVWARAVGLVSVSCVPPCAASRGPVGAAGPRLSAAAATGPPVFPTETSSGQRERRGRAGTLRGGSRSPRQRPGFRVVRVGRLPGGAAEHPEAVARGAPRTNQLQPSPPCTCLHQAGVPRRAQPTGSGRLCPGGAHGGRPGGGQEAGLGRERLVAVRGADAGRAAASSSWPRAGPRGGLGPVRFSKRL